MKDVFKSVAPLLEVFPYVQVMQFFFPFFDKLMFDKGNVYLPICLAGGMAPENGSRFLSPFCPPVFGQCPHSNASKYCS